MSRGDIFLNTTNIDNTPVSVLEAMACGLCVVSTNVGGIPYLLEHEHDALLVPPNDPQAMATAVHRLLNEPDLAERLSRNARQKAAQCDWSIILPQWEALLTSVMTRNMRESSSGFHVPPPR
jgi:glycosyltransferase involved in cell wall biosynthesis